MKIITILVVAIVALAGTAVLLTSNHGGNDSGSDRETITIVGSTTVSPVMLAIKEVYENDHNVTMNITANGSGAGAAAAMNGTADIGMLSRDLKSSEKDGGLVQVTIGMDGIAVIINKSVTGVTTLTLQQLADIYSGKITNWSDVGGNDLTINVLSREDGSGTRDGFETALKTVDSDFTTLTKKIEQTSTNAIINATDSTKGSIGYISIGYISKIGSNTSAIQINGVDATDDNVIEGTYAIQRNLVLVTKGEATGASAELINWIINDDGQKILTSKGYIALFVGDRF